MSDYQSDRYEEDTISLIDLITVLIRYRKMIVWGTVAVGFVAAVVLYGLPAAGVLEPKETEYITEVRLTVNPIPPEVERYMGLSTVGALRGFLTDTQVVANAYRQVESDLTETAPPPDRTEEQLLSYVNREIVRELLKTSWNSQTSVLSVRFTSAKPEAATRFLELLISEVREQFVSFTQSRSGLARRRLERDLEQAKIAISAAVMSTLSDDENDLPSSLSDNRLLSLLEAEASSSLSSIARLQSAQDELELISSNVDTIFERLGTPIVMEDEPEGSGRLTRLVISLITAFFLLVFAAFVRQYAANVRKDEGEMSKLKSAWSQGKRTRS